jgi:transmembrane sensor
MDENYILAKWLNNELNESEQSDFEASTDFETYNKIKHYSAQLKVANFDENKMLTNVLNAKKPKVISLYNNWLYRIAAVFILGFGLNFLYQNLSIEKRLAEFGNETAFNLPDNSEVILNSGSEIEFKKWNWDNNRELKLNGEAYFHVAKGKKFEVATNLGTVTVLGTQFDVKARKNRFDVVCFEGRVRVNYNKTQILLTHGQSVTFENGKQVNLTHNDEKPDWLENKIAFQNENLKNIIDEIQRKYNVKIEMKSAFSQELFTGKIPSDNLEIALQSIATIYKLNVTNIDNKNIIFVKK